MQPLSLIVVHPRPAPTSYLRMTAPDHHAQNLPWIALCYHDVQPGATALGGGPERFSVPVDAFALMLDTIAAQGMQGCSLERAFDVVAGPRVAITFDDATLGQFEHAMPALRSRGMTATVYAVIDWVGRPGFMTWDQLREIKSWGMSVQSHSWSHPFLSECDADRLRRELGGSKARIDEELVQDTREIAFPGGDAPPRRLRRLIAEAGYSTPVGTRWGVNTGQPLPGRFVRRCTVRGGLTREVALKYLSADPVLAWQQQPKEFVLRGVRATLGASRYARWRRRLLDAIRPPG